MTEDQLLAEECLKHRLYSHPHWCLRMYLQLIQQGVEGYVIKVHRLDGKPVGVVVKSATGFLQVFVRKRERGKGIGSLLVNSVKDETCYGSLDSPSKGKIFIHNGIEAKL